MSNDKTPQKFFSPVEHEWLDLEESTDENSQNIKANNDALRDMLLMALQMPNLIVLAGSGTSLGAEGPGMRNLWDHCVNKIAGAKPDEAREKTEKAKNVIEKTNFNGEDNIEALLSHCEAWLQINPDDPDVKNFITQSKQIILNKCTEFLKEESLETHRTFLRKLSRRNNRNPRLKIFTTNYDLCFERAAVSQNLVVIDGFSFSKPRRFNPLHFSYDIVRRPRATEEQGSYLEGVFHLLKLHGSVNWARSDNFIEERKKPSPEEACLIYPVRGKYQQSYVQPHLELVSQFFASLREPNTCVIAVGFGFNDDHLSEPMLAAIKTNPTLKFIVVDPFAENSAEGKNAKASHYWQDLYQLAQNDTDVWLLNADFSQFVALIPDLKALSRAQKLEQAVINSVKGSL